MPCARFHLASRTEDRKQLYWGAFMLGAAAFQQHRTAGLQLDNDAVDQFADARFHSISDSWPEAPFVDSAELGRSCFIEAFVAGYRERSSRAIQRPL
jgi:hypothetical protein